MGLYADLLVTHQRHSNVIAKPGRMVACCACGWQQEYTERGQGYRLWAAHVEAEITAQDRKM